MRMGHGFAVVSRKGWCVAVTHAMVREDDVVILTRVSEAHARSWARWLNGQQ